MTIYAPYILASYGLALVSMSLVLLWTKRQRQRTLKRLKQWFNREAR